jgi:hypothetical protein
MRWFEWWRWRHTLLLIASAGFLAAYFGLISWGHVERALERLAAEGRIEAFQSPMGRGEAIVTSFMFVMLSPLAALAAFGLYTVTGAVVAGFLRTLIPSSAVPDWLLTVLGYGAVVGTASYAHPLWFPYLVDVAALIARALLIASGG